MASGAVGVVAAVRGEILEEKSRSPAAAEISEDDADDWWASQGQLTAKGASGGGLHGMGAGNEVDSEAQNFWRAPKVAEMLR